LLIDLRYHLGSLVAVFLALGIGILTGYSLFGKEGLLEQQQQQLVDELEVRFARLKDEREQLELNLARLAQELERDRNLVRSIQPLLIKERLSGRHILLFVTGTAVEKDCITEVTSALVNAGARIAGVIHLPKGIGAETIAGLVSALKDPKALKEAAGQMLQLGTDDGPIDGAILIGGALEGAAAFQEIDLPLIEGLVRLKVPVIGAEPFGVPVSYAGDYQKMSIPTVDNIDTPAGLIGLVFLLSEGVVDYLEAASGMEAD
jgi:hypothetical protein